MKTILICEDEPNIADSYQLLLGEGFQYAKVTSLAELRDLLAEQRTFRPDLFVADLVLTDGLLHEALACDANLQPCLSWPTLVVSVKEDQEILEQCLRRWARDYITKPFVHGEFVVKAKRILEGTAFYKQPFSFCPLSMQVKSEAGVSDPLTAQEAKLFNILISRPLYEARKEELMRSVWGEVEETSKLVVTITRLRKKISPLGLSLLYQQESGTYRIRVKSAQP